MVGVILNLAVWFGWHILRPESGHWDWFAIIVTAAAFLALVRWKWDVLAVVGGGALGAYQAGVYAALAEADIR